MRNIVYSKSWIGCHFLFRFFRFKLCKWSCSLKDAIACLLLLWMARLLLGNQKWWHLQIFAVRAIAMLVHEINWLLHIVHIMSRWASPSFFTLHDQLLHFYHCCWHNCVDLLSIINFENLLHEVFRLLLSFHFFLASSSSTTSRAAISFCRQVSSSSSSDMGCATSVVPFALE